MKVSRDRTYLLDRLLKYENPESELSEDESDTSVEEPIPPPNMGKKRKIVDGHHIPNKRPDGAPKRKYTKHKQLAAQQQANNAIATTTNSGLISNNHHHHHREF